MYNLVEPVVITFQNVVITRETEISLRQSWTTVLNVLMIVAFLHHTIISAFATIAPTLYFTLRNKPNSFRIILN
jgi:hypothetical protein